LGFNNPDGFYVENGLDDNIFVYNYFDFVEALVNIQSLATCLKSHYPDLNDQEIIELIFNHHLPGNLAQKFNDAFVQGNGNINPDDFSFNNLQQFIFYFQDTHVSEATGESVNPTLEEGLICSSLWVNDVINGTGNNTNTNPTLSLECIDAIDLFAAEYDLDLKKPQEIAINSAVLDAVVSGDLDCSDQAALNEIGLKAFLEANYSVKMAKVFDVDGTIFGKDENGVLHVYLDPVDMASASDLEILEQFILVINRVRAFFCIEQVYEPIDWMDYFDNLQGISGSTTWNNCETSFELSLHLHPSNIMDTSPGWSNSNGFDWKWTWSGDENSIPMFIITTNMPCVDEMESIIYSDC